MEYIIEHGDKQFYVELWSTVPNGYVDRDGTITVELGHAWDDAELTFEDEVRVLEADTRKVIFNSEDEQWER